MITYKSIEFKQKTAQMVLESDRNEFLSASDKIEISALAALMGGYNHLRQFSPSDTPIDLEELEELKLNFQDVISKTAFLLWDGINPDEIKPGTKLAG